MRVCLPVVTLISRSDLLRAEGKERKAEETLSEVLDKAREADKRLRKEGSERERLSNELNKVGAPHHTSGRVWTSRI